MKYSILLTLSLLTSACLTAQDATKLTPEQIAAWSQTNENVYACIYAGGPPGAGSLVFVIVPKESKPDIQFSPSCNLISGKVGQ